MPLKLQLPALGDARADAEPPPFTCPCMNGGPDAARVRVCGELDIATAPELERTLDATHARLVVLDLRELAFIDGCGMRAIITAAARARQDGRRLVLVRVPAIMDRLLELTESAGQVEIADRNQLPRPVHEVQRSLVTRSLLMDRRREAAS